MNNRQKGDFSNSPERRQHIPEVGRFVEPRTIVTGEYNLPEGIVNFDIINGKIQEQESSIKHICGQSDDYNNAEFCFKGSIEEMMSCEKGRNGAYIRNYMKSNMHYDDKYTETPKNVFIPIPDFYDALKIFSFDSKLDPSDVIDNIHLFTNGLIGNDKLKTLGNKIYSFKQKTVEYYDIYIFFLQSLHAWFKTKDCSKEEKIILDGLINDFWFFDESASAEYFFNNSEFPEFEKTTDFFIYLTSLTDFPERRKVVKSCIKFHEEKLYDTFSIDKLVETFIEREKLQKNEKYIRSVISTGFIERKHNSSSSVVVSFSLTKKTFYNKEMLEIFGISNEVMRSIRVEKYILDFRNCIVDGIGTSSLVVDFAVEGQSKRLPEIVIKNVIQYEALQKLFTDVVIPHPTLFKEIKKLINSNIENFSTDAMENIAVVVYDNVENIPYIKMFESIKAILQKENVRDIILLKGIEMLLMEANDKYIKSIPIGILYDDANPVVYKGGFINFRYDGNTFQINDIMIDMSTLKNSSKAIQLKIIVDGETRVIKNLNYKPISKPTPRKFFINKINNINMKIVKAKEIENIDNRENLLGAYSPSPGLFTHQITLIEKTYDMIERNLDMTIVCNSVVSSGKTTSVIALVKSLPRRLVFYVASREDLLREMFLMAKSACISPLLAYKSQKGTMVIKNADNNEVSIHDIFNHNMIICHTRVLNKILATLKHIEEADEDNEETFPHPLVILDEFDTAGINTTREHAIGALMAMKPRFFIVLSASIDEAGPIQFYRSISPIITFINSNQILVPTELRQMNGEPMDLFNWEEPRKHIQKLKSNSFFMRFISKINLTNEIVPHTFQKNLMDIHIYEPSIIFGLYEKHKKSELAKYAYSNEDETNLIKTIKYNTIIGTPTPEILFSQIYGNAIEKIIAELKRKATIFLAKERDLKELQDMKQPNKKEIAKALFAYEKYDMRDEDDNSISGGYLYAKREFEKRKFEKANLEPRQNTVVKKKKIEPEREKTEGDDDEYERKKAEDEAKKKKEMFPTFDKWIEETYGFADGEYYRVKHTRALIRRDKIQSIIREKITMINQCEDRIENILEEEGIYHLHRPLLKSETLKCAHNGSSREIQECILSTIGVFIQNNNSNIPKKSTMNRMFFKETKGLNRPFEAAIVTKAFEQSNTTDAILQFIGRTGRTGLSTTSICYMSPDCYNKIINEEKDSDTLDVLIRSRFYRQNSYVNDIMAPIENDDTKRRLHFLEKALVESRFF